MSTPGKTVEQMAGDNFAFLQREVYEASGVVLEQDKQYLVEARLGALARQRALSSVNDLCALLRATHDPQLRWEIVEALTTHETQFFREPEQFRVLREVLLPELLEQHGIWRPLECWSAGTATGREAYSLAMLAREMGLESWQVRILGTDIAEGALARARAGRYSQLEINRGLPAAYLTKYFRREGLNWQLSDQIRRMVRFERHDLRRSPPAYKEFDLVLCRNVLIYFDAGTRRCVAERIREALRPGGYLLVGTVEGLPEIEAVFKRREIGALVAYQAR